ncbi:MAG: cation transporter [Acidimicrobiia bacterium]|nr:cation transporter [Acidimicrobiia bacterium]
MGPTRDRIDPTAGDDRCEDGASSARIALDIEGMHCASCVSTVSRALGDAEGVDAADVNLASRRATVTYDPDRVTVEDLRDRVAAVGYRAVDPSTGEGADEDAEIRDTGYRLVGAVALAVPLALISMVPALQFDGWEWLAFALATPLVLVAGWTFHSSALAAVRHRQLGMDSLVSLGTLAAWAWSTVVLLFLGAGHGDGGRPVYFETAGVIITLILLGTLARGPCSPAFG